MRLKIITLISIFVLMCLGVVSASISNTDCGSKALFRVSGTTNAHAGTYTESYYSYFVCFDEYEGAGSIRDGTNGVIKLSAITNAHVQVPTGNYPETIYSADDVRCQVSLVECSAASKGTTVARLSGDTNAHVTNPSDASYPRFLCCENLCGNGILNTGEECDGNVFMEPYGDGVGECPNYDSNYYSGDLGCTSQCKISADESNCNSNFPCRFTYVDWVKDGDILEDGEVVNDGEVLEMVIEGEYCDGKSVTFEIYEHDSLFPDLINVISGTFDRGTWTSHWTYVANQYSPGYPEEDDDDIGNDPRDYYFEAILDDDNSVKETSNLVEVACVPNTCADLGKECGDWDDGCGGMTGSCGDCDSIYPGQNRVCQEGICVSGPCEFVDVYWSEEVLATGEVADLIAETSGNCIGKQAIFSIKEEDGALEGGFDDNIVIDFSTAELSANGFETPWVTEFHNDGNGLFLPSEHYFEVRLDDDSASDDSKSFDSYLAVTMCGDGYCDANEDTGSCPQDCGGVGYCTPQEEGDEYCEDNTHKICWFDGNDYIWDETGCSSDYCFADSNPTNDECVECTESSHCTDIPAPGFWSALSCTADNSAIIRTRINYNNVCLTDYTCDYPTYIQTDITQCGSGENCQDGECIKSLYWADMDGAPINEAQVRDNVFMIWKNSGLVEGTEKDFTIEELTWDNEEVRGDSNPVVGISDGNGDVKAVWTITQEDYDKTGSQHDRYVFHVDGKDSNEMKITGTESNSRPSISITEPVDGSKYTIDYSSADKTTAYIDFKQDSSDIDDDLKITWDFGDGSAVEEFESCSTSPAGTCDTNHRYSSSGTKTIFATAEEMGRTSPRVAINYSNIYIYKKGVNVFSKIGSPIVEGRVVEMDGSESFACECFETENDCGDAVNCYEIDDDIDLLWCKDFERGVDYKFIFQWIFDEGATKEETKIIGEWKCSEGATECVDDYDEVVKFTHFFPGLGVHTVRLKTGYIELCC